LKFNADGSAGLTEYAYGDIPPEAVTGTKDVTATFLVSVEFGTALVKTNVGYATVRVNVELAVCPRASVTVTV
jgi:hypothetical protein